MGERRCPDQTARLVDGAVARHAQSPALGAARRECYSGPDAQEPRRLEQYSEARHSYSVLRNRYLERYSEAGTRYPTLGARYSEARYSEQCAEARSCPGSVSRVHAHSSQAPGGSGRPLAEVTLHPCPGGWLGATGQAAGGIVPGRCVAGAAGEERASGHQAGTVSPRLSSHQAQGHLSRPVEIPGSQEEEQGAREQRGLGVVVPSGRGGVRAPWEPVGGVLVARSSRAGWGSVTALRRGAQTL